MKTPLLLLALLACSLLPALAADPPDKGKQAHVSAKLKSGTQKWEFTPNSLGSFPVVVTATNTPIEIKIRYPQVSDGTLAVVSVRDGGTVSASVPDGGKGKGKGGTQTATGSTVRPRIGNSGKLQFTFLYGRSFHYQRVTVDIGKQQHVFEFHVDH